MSEDLRNMLGEEVYKRWLLEPTGVEYQKLQERRHKINKYNLYQWNGGEGIWGTIVEMNKQHDLRLKQIAQERIMWLTKGKVRPKLKDIKIRHITPLSKNAIMALRLGFTQTEKFKIFERADWKCEWCGNEYALHADHIKPKSRYPELAHDWKQNGRALCAKCHAERHEMELTRGYERLKVMAERQMRTAKVPTKYQAAWRIFRRLKD